MSKYKLLPYLLCSTFILIALLAGCQQNQGSNLVGSTLPKETPPAAESVDSFVSELKIAVPGDAGTLNIYTGSSKYDFMTELVLDKLFGPSPYVEEPQPWLAESAEQVDELTWVVKIRSGISWHDGEPFTAEDVKFTFENYRDGAPNRYTHHMSEVPYVEKIELDDPFTVRLTCAYPCPSLARITLADLPILPKHIWEQVENPRTYTGLPIGTGPYQLVEYKPDQYYRFEANKEYFKGRPLVDTLLMPIIKDQTSVFNALRSGEIDATASIVPPELVDSFKKLPDMKVIRTSQLSLIELRLNYVKAPFDLPEFRQALALSVDRKGIADTVMLGQARAGLQGYPHPDSPWTNPQLSTPFDPDKAKKIMDGLNFVDRDGDGIRETSSGEALDFSIKVSSNEPGWIRSAELLKQQFANVGIKTKVEVLDSAAISAQVKAKEHDIYINSIGPHGVADPDQFIMSHRSSYLWTKDIPYPEMDELIKKWMASDTIEARKQISFDMQTLFNKQPTSIVLFYPNGNYAYRSDKYDLWEETLGYGIVHKFSLLPRSARDKAMVEK